MLLCAPGGCGAIEDRTQDRTLMDIVHGGVSTYSPRSAAMSSLAYPFVSVSGRPSRHVAYIRTHIVPGYAPLDTRADLLLTPRALTSSCPPFLLPLARCLSYFRRLGGSGRACLQHIDWHPPLYTRFHAHRTDANSPDAEDALAMDSHSRTPSALSSWRRHGRLPHCTHSLRRYRAKSLTPTYMELRPCLRVTLTGLCASAFPKTQRARQFDFYLHRANSTPTRLFIAASRPVPLTPPSPGLSSSRDLAWTYRPSRKTRLPLCIVCLWLVSVTLGSDRLLLEGSALLLIPPATPVVLFPPESSHAALLLRSRWRCSLTNFLFWLQAEGFLIYMSSLPTFCRFEFACHSVTTNPCYFVLSLVKLLRQI
ncbi:hypothetical protein B0H13DRAFT_499219 [Mycena leptocephala]|nr:hypothetical protein B0H13DRAFT_499219 [Mycena leptocephala]